MKKPSITVIPPSSLLPDNRKHRVGGYMKVIYNGKPSLMDRSLIYYYFEEVVSQYPNWELVDVFADVIDEEFITFQGIIAAIQAAKQNKIDILLIKSHKDLLGITDDVILLKRILSSIGVKVYFIQENFNYFSGLSS